MSSWIWPVPGYGKDFITSYFGYRTQPTAGASTNHKGIDIGAPYGTPIVAVNSGTVISSGPASGYGKWVRIDHGGGIITIYGHMQSIYVSVGQSVKAGDTIAGVGSEGVSTGPHLHFQLELNGVPQNPLSYVSPDGTTVIAGTAGDTNSISPESYTTEIGGTVYPETISNTSSQPLVAFVELYIGEQKLTLLPPRYFIDFEMSKSVGDAGSTFTITLFDDNWEEVEYLCSRNQQNVKFRYGYTTGRQSQFYQATLNTYSIDFNSTGVLLTIQGMTTGPVTNLQNMTIDTGVINPTEAAKIVAKSAGWSVSDENFHPSYDVPSSTRDSYALVNERPATYIINKLAPLAVRTSDNKGGFRFYLDETTEPPTAYFRPIDIAADTVRTYVYMKGVDSPVIDLQLSVNGVLGGSSFGELVTTEETTTFIDPDTKEEVQASEALNASNGEVVGEYSPTRSSQYTSTIDAAGSSREEMNAMLRYRAEVGFMPYEGYLTVLGDPTINLSVSGEIYIRLLIIDDFGNLHHTSGLYMIDSIKDTISGGIMTTTMHIQRQHGTTGIELVNYRTLLK